MDAADGGDRRRSTDDDRRERAFNEALGVELNAARRWRGLTQEQLAKRASPPLNPSTVFRYEKGERQRVSLATVAAICALLDVDAGKLINRVMQRVGYRFPRCRVCGGKVDKEGKAVE